MLSKNIIQVYQNEEGDAVVVVGVFEGVGKPVNPHHLVIPITEARAIAKALTQLADEAEEDWE